MAKGIGFAIAACFFWGWVFVIPGFMPGFNSFEVALGRCLVYGVFSLFIFTKALQKGGYGHPKSIWLNALFFSLISTFAYYTLHVLAIRYSSPSTSVLIFGMSPLTIAFYGNFKDRELPFKNFIFPSLLTLFGLIILHLPRYQASCSTSNYLLGLLFPLLTLATGTWSLVNNSRFLKQHPEVAAYDWSTLIGVSTLFWVALFGIILSLFFQDHFEIDKFFIFDEKLKQFLLGSLALGVLCSWLGSFLWSKASLNLPVTLTGQIIIFEKIFGLLFIYLIEQSLPSGVEIAGIAILLLAIVYGIKKFSEREGALQVEHS